MGIRSVTYYESVCDGCGTTEADPEYSAWADAGAARDAAIQYGWHETGELLRCPKCLTCHKCGAKATRIGIGPGDDDVPLCADHETVYEDDDE